MISNRTPVARFMAALRWCWATPRSVADLAGLCACLPDVIPNLAL